MKNEKIHRCYLIKLRKLKQVKQQMVAEYLVYITQYYQKLEYGYKGWSEKEMARVFELLSKTVWHLNGDSLCSGD